MEVKFADGKSITFEDCWLRDHCRCSSCYHAATFQRAKHILDIPEVFIFEVQFEKTHILITWEDDHRSVFQADFLIECDFNTWTENRRLKPVLWSGNTVAEKVARLDIDKFLNSVDGAKSVFKSLLDYGIAFIEGVSIKNITTCNS
ncbi:trimethyllysine dioxygenase, mitochondrial-like [Hyposmocoma kahamanoa]|uniref:trimethyllysine dioxygenase, mitochondrial-like n=1 Tax=Hyposmocoma kahamanoa TaxID=1477025 RepID=UPI000E6D6080|nr:trimethyllysine dioxygenase, mitochondrial-like [Hyposmocoma kahamanoa]